MSEPRTKAMSLYFDGMKKMEVDFYCEDRGLIKTLKYKGRNESNSICAQLETMEKYGVRIDWESISYGEMSDSERTITFTPALDTQRLTRLVNRAIYN